MMGTMSSIKEIMQFCRLCLVKDQVNVSIFEEHGDTRDVKRKISECLPVTVSEEDSLPKKICDGCLYKLELLYQFRTTCVSAEKQLQVWIAELNNSESKEDQDLKLQHSQTSVKEEIFDATDHPDNSEYVIEEQHISYEEGDIPYNESQDDNDDGDATNSSDDEPLAKRRKRFLEEQVQTDDTLKTADNKMAITKLEHESDDENVDDPEPNFVSVGTSDDQQPGPSGLNKMSATTTNAEMPSSSSKEDQTCQEEIGCIETMSCIKCKNTFDTKSSFSKHFPKCTGSRLIPCEICQKKFESNTEKMYHVKRAHDPSRITFACTICDKTFMTQIGVKRHEGTHVNQFKYGCTECDKKYNLKTSLDHHVAVEHKGIRYQCKECGKSFTDKRYMKEHSFTHKEDYVPKRFTCTVCDKKMTSKHYFLRHVACHSNPNVTSVVCEVCGKTVTSKSSLRDHMMIHTGEKPFECKVCGKMFNKARLLKIHIRIHTKEKPHVCDICGKAFSQRSTLVIHNRLHSGEKPFVCVICNKRFYTKSILKTHSKSHGEPLSSTKL
ncbi:gastrula zinc finger protein XlCGF26.1-like isoform X11 [Onthophagus taurus]|uniref:gastrula zinc finger protein XlCGF26.1-like isoform X11 n=1 Tax=Onthophagus taurus TaxID=166361 RepID=UPI0039BE7B8A